jgi:hypothetical protein
MRSFLLIVRDPRLRRDDSGRSVRRQYRGVRTGRLSRRLRWSECRGDGQEAGTGREVQHRAGERCLGEAQRLRTRP